MWNTATAITVSSSQVVVVVFGGLDGYISEDHDFREQPMKLETAVLEFGNKIIVGTYSHIKLFVAM